MRSWPGNSSGRRRKLANCCASKSAFAPPANGWPPLCLTWWMPAIVGPESYAFCVRWRCCPDISHRFLGERTRLGYRLRRLAASLHQWLTTLCLFRARRTHRRGVDGNTRGRVCSPMLVKNATYRSGGTETCAIAGGFGEGFFAFSVEL